MTRLKSLAAISAVVCVFTLCASSGAKAAQPKCAFNGNYSFFFWDPSFPAAGVGYFSVQLNPGAKCRSGVVLPGGIINCNVLGTEFEDFIESGSVFLETDGEGTMEIETNSSRGICGTETNAIELDISVVSGGKSMLFSSNGVELVQSGTTPNAGYFATVTGRADKCWAGDLLGCYDVRFWVPDEPAVADCTICASGGFVTGGTCRCNTNFGSGEEFLSEIETGGYTLGENCQSSTGFLFFTVSSDPVCGIADTVYLDFAAAQQGKELIGACDPFTSEFATCAFEGFLQ